MLGKEISDKVQLYIKKTREGGGAVSVRSIIVSAQGIVRVLKLNCSVLVEFGEPVTLNKHWAWSSLK